MTNSPRLVFCAGALAIGFLGIGQYSWARTAPVAQRYDFGSIPSSASRITHVFEIVNTTSSVIVLDRISTSCRCTSASLEDGSSKMPVTLKSGEHGLIRVTVSIARQAPGKLAKYVYVYRRGETAPMFSLEMDAIAPQPAPHPKNYNQ